MTKKNTVYIPTYRSYTWLALLHTRVAQNPATKTMLAPTQDPTPQGQDIGGVLNKSLNRSDNQKIYHCIINGLV